VKLLVPLFAWSSKAFPLSAVTVCAIESSFFTLIFAPGATDVGVVYLKSLIVMVAAEEPAEPDSADDPDAPVDPDEPQAVTAVRKTAQTQDTTTLRNRRPGLVARFSAMAVLTPNGSGRR